MDLKDKKRIMDAVRKGFMRSQTYRNVLARAVSISEFGIRGGKRYICSDCKGAFPKGDVEIHHIDPVIPKGEKSTDMSIEYIIHRTYCSETNLRVLCKDCHKKVTYS